MHPSQDASGVVADRERKDAEAAAQARIQATEEAAAKEKKAAEAEKAALEKTAALEKAALEKAAAQAQAEANREAQLKHAKLHEKEQEALIQVCLIAWDRLFFQAKLGCIFTPTACASGNHAAARAQRRAFAFS